MWIGLHRRHRAVARAASVAVGIAALALAASAGAATSAGVSFGVAEDASKYADDGGAAVYTSLADLGMTVNRWTIRYTGNPETIAEQAFLDRAAPIAHARGIRVIASVYNQTSATPDVGAFCAWVGTVARRYPTIREYIIGNEVNAARFWSPQHSETEPFVGAKTYYATLSTCYDVLKGIDPEIVVAGMGLSPRAVSNTSTAPLLFLKVVGQLYVEAGRTTPIMDRLAIHPYPNPNASPPPPPSRAAYENEGFFGLAQLDRVKQAVYTAFNGTGQPTTVDGLDLVVDEIGYQTVTAGMDEYSGDENSPVVDDATQSVYHREIIELTACDPDISDVLLFHLIDETTRTAGAESGGWQSGLLRPSGKPKDSYSAVKAAIAAGCSTVKPAWAPPQTSATTQDTTKAPTESPLEKQLRAIARKFEAMPALAIEGEPPGDLLRSEIVTDAAARLSLAIARDVIDMPDGDASLVRKMPPLFWGLPTRVKSDVLVASGLAHLELSNERVADYEIQVKFDLGGTVAWVKLCKRFYYDEKGDRVETTSPVCDLRVLMGRSPARPKLTLAASGTGRVKAGRRLSGKMRLRRRAPGIYLPFVALAPAGGPRAKVTLLRLRPFVVMPRPAGNARPQARRQPSSPPAQR